MLGCQSGRWTDMGKFDVRLCWETSLKKTGITAGWEGPEGSRGGEMAALYMNFKVDRLMSLCQRSIPRDSPLLSVTCKWQEDGVITLDTPPPCFWGGPDNCYGNGMLPRSVDGLSRAASQPDESFDPACLFTSVPVAPSKWLVCKLRVSFIAVLNRVPLRMKCVVNPFKSHPYSGDVCDN